MKEKVLVILSVLFFASCVSDDSYPKTESITKGAKWTLKIGSSPVEVYAQLQELGLEKNFEDVAVVYRKPLAGPEEIKSDLSLYRAITLTAPTERVERVVIQFDQDKVKSIESGGALLNDISKWPENNSDESTIYVDESVNEVQKKLLSIYQNPVYQSYEIILSDKWLKKAFDPDMANYDQWYFAFTTDVSSSKSGNSSVKLFFKEGRLSKIQHQYSEAGIMN